MCNAVASGSSGATSRPRIHRGGFIPYPQALYPQTPNDSDTKAVANPAPAPLPEQEIRGRAA
jgi:hypothetical protein